MRFVSWTIAAFLGLITLLIDLLMLPIWLLWLGCVLRSVSDQGGAYASHAPSSAASALEMAEPGSGGGNASKV